MSDQEKVAIKRAIARLYLSLYVKKLTYSRNFYQKSKNNIDRDGTHSARIEYTKKLKKVSKYYSKLYGHKLNYSIAKEILDQKGSY
jgi:hypothetical protein